MARIVFTLEDGTEIETELDAEVITVGRHPDSIVVLPSASVSSHHATIKQRGDSFYVQDLGTTNGTRLNGVEVEEARLEDGDQVTFGDIPAVVHLTSGVAPPPLVVPVVPVPLAASAPVATKFATIRSVPMPTGPRRVARPVQQYQESSGCAGFLTFIFFLVLAFVIGLHVRHGVETGGFLTGDILKKIRDGASIESNAAPATPGTPAPSPAAPAAPAAPESSPKPAAPAPAAPSMMGDDAAMMDGGSGMAPNLSAPPAKEGSMAPTMMMEEN